MGRPVRHDPDAHPIIDRVADGVVTACGFSGHGFMQSLAVGRAVAELVLEQNPSFDLAPDRLDRFALEAVFPEQVAVGADVATQAQNGPRAS